MSEHEKNLCHVGNYADIEKEGIRQHVCRDLSVEYKINNSDYCLLHAPTLDKDHEEFERLFKERIKANESYFQAVVFPTPLDFTHYNFGLPLNFTHATFLSNVTFYKVRIKFIYFDYAKFHGLAQFHRSFFSELATFTGATFYREAWFTGSHFKGSKFDHVTLMALLALIVGQDSLIGRISVSRNFSDRLISIAPYLNPLLVSMKRSSIRILKFRFT